MRYLALLSVFPLFGCTALHCGGPSNVAVCQEFVEKVRCERTDVSTTYPCESYAGKFCDLAPYFECLSTHYVCVNGQYAQEKLRTVEECNGLLAC